MLGPCFCEREESREGVKQGTVLQGGLDGRAQKVNSIKAVLSTIRVRSMGRWGSGEKMRINIRDCCHLCTLEVIRAARCCCQCIATIRNFSTSGKSQKYYK